MCSVIGIVAGKGGVGKSTISVNLALVLKKIGLKVGLLDADVYGPSLRKMLSCAILPSQNSEFPERINPAESFGIRFISMGFFMPEKEAAVIRAPIANGVIQQFLNQVDWGELDYLIIDFPPGTGDIQLTLMQQGKLDGALIVTTPQEIALLDVRKAVRMLDQLNVPILGVIENMSHYLGQYLFGCGGGTRLSRELSVPLLGQIPIEPYLCQCADEGRSPFEDFVENEAIQEFYQIAKQLLTFKAMDDEIDEIDLEDSLLTIRWKDGFARSHPLYLLQQHCPCIRCRHETQQGTQVTATSFERIGRYALQLQFSSGCSFGIYPFSLLRRL